MRGGGGGGGEFWKKQMGILPTTKIKIKYNIWAQESGQWNIS